MPQRETGKRLSEYNNILKENDNLYRGVAKRLGLPECAFWIFIYPSRGQRRSDAERDRRSSISAEANGQFGSQESRGGRVYRTAPDG